MTHTRHWNNWGEAIAHAKTAPHTTESSHTNGFSFTQTSSFEEAIELAENGWEEGALRALPRVERITAAITAQVQQQRIVTEAYPSGRGYDLPAVLTGHPEHWYRLDPDGNGTRPQVKLSISLCQSGGIPARVAEIKGAALAALASAFQLNGQDVMIQADYSTGRADKVSDIVTIKDYNQPLDLTSIIFAIGHASSLRRIGFALWENGSTERRAAAGVKPYDGYGMPCDCPDEFKGDIHIPSSYLYDDDVDWNNEGSVTKWVHRKLSDNGVSMAEE